MFESLIVTLREGIEAALVVGIVVIYLRRTGRTALSRWVYAGLGAGIAASLVCAALFAALEVEEEAYEGWLMLAGSVLVAGMVLWMLRTARTLKSQIEAKLETITSRSEGAVAAGLFGLTFVLILREGVETVLFLAAVNLTTDALLSFIGGLAGILLAVLFGISLVRGTVRIDLPRFFKVTSVVLFLLAAQLLVGGLHEFGERGLIPISRTEMTIIGPIVKSGTMVLASLLALPLIFLLVPGRALRGRTAHARTLQGPERRLALATIRRENFWRRTFAGAGIFVVASLTVSFAFTRLPALDPPALVGADAAGEVRIPKEGLDDGHLHRFGVTIDGTIVRFFVIKTGTRLVPAFDACQVCGASGYAETKGHLVCLACAADIKPSTIGVGGGCNPLPLPYKDKGRELVVTVKDLGEKTPTFRESAN